MNLIAAVTQFFRPAPAVVMHDDHAFLLDDPTIVEIRQGISVSDVQLSAMNRHSAAFIQHLHYTQAAGSLQQAQISEGQYHTSQPGVTGQDRIKGATEIIQDEASKESWYASLGDNLPGGVVKSNLQQVVGPAGTFPLPEDAQMHHPATRPLASAPLHSHDIAYLVQRGEKVVKPEFDEEAPRIKVGEIDDHLASNTGAGSPRSQLMYQLNLIRDAVASAQNQNRDVGYELDPKIIELYEDSFSAFVHEKMSNTVTLICQLYNEDRNGLFETVENLGYTLWTPDKGKNLYLKILTRTAKIHL